MDYSSLTDPVTGVLRLGQFEAVVTTVLPIVGVAVLVGFLFYVIRWAIGLFRGI